MNVMGPGMLLASTFSTGRCTMKRKPLVRLIQDAIDKGATTVEEVHKSIADLPLRILEESELLREPAKEAKRLQDRTLGKIYDTIRAINEQVGTYASELLAESATRRAARSEATRTRRSAHAAGAS
jgi:hypothetical protein